MVNGEKESASVDLRSGGRKKTAIIAIAVVSATALLGFVVWRVKKSQAGKERAAVGQAWANLRVCLTGSTSSSAVNSTGKLASEFQRDLAVAVWHQAASNKTRKPWPVRCAPYAAELAARAAKTKAPSDSPIYELGRFAESSEKLLRDSKIVTAIDEMDELANKAGFAQIKGREIAGLPQPLRPTLNAESLAPFAAGTKFELERQSPTTQVVIVMTEVDGAEKATHHCLLDQSVTNALHCNAVTVPAIGETVEITEAAKTRESLPISKWVGASPTLGLYRWYIARTESNANATADTETKGPAAIEYLLYDTLNTRATLLPPVKPNAVADQKTVWLITQPPSGNAGLMAFTNGTLTTREFKNTHGSHVMLKDGWVIWTEFQKSAPVSYAARLEQDLQKLSPITLPYPITNPFDELPNRVFSDKNSRCGGENYLWTVAANASNEETSRQLSILRIDAAGTALSIPFTYLLPIQSCSKEEVTIARADNTLGFHCTANATGIDCAELPANRAVVSPGAVELRTASKALSIWTSEDASRNEAGAVFYRVADLAGSDTLDDQLLIDSPHGGGRSLNVLSGFVHADRGYVLLESDADDSRHLIAFDANGKATPITVTLK